MRQIAFITVCLLVLQKIPAQPAIIYTAGKQLFPSVTTLRVKIHIQDFTLKSRLPPTTESDTLQLDVTESNYKEHLTVVYILRKAWNSLIENNLQQYNDAYIVSGIIAKKMVAGFADTSLAANYFLTPVNYRNSILKNLKCPVVKPGQYSIRWRNIYAGIKP